MWRDTWLIFRRGMVLSLRNPVWVVISMMQPILYLVLFGPLMEKITKTPGFPPGSSWQILTPALLVQLGLFGSAFVGFGLIAEYRAGVIERMRVTPASRVGLLLGRVLRDAVQLVAQGILITVLAVLLFGLRAPLYGIVFSLVMVALLGITMSASSYALALILKSEDSFAPLLNSVLLPVLLLSGIMIPITTGLAPNWLYWISRINPFTHIVDAERAGFRGDFALNAILTGSVVLLVLAALSVWWGARTFQRESG